MEHRQPGSEEFYKFIDHNLMFQMQPVDYVNDPYVIGQNYKQTSINGCQEVDLQDRSILKTVNGRQVQRIGGQLDHVRGAHRSAKAENPLISH